MREQIFIEFKSSLQVTDLEGCLIKFEQPPDKESIIIQKARNCSFTVPVTVIKSSFWITHFSNNKICSFLGIFCIPGFMKCLGSLSQGCYHQSIPVCQDLVILTGVDTVFTNLE